MLTLLDELKSALEADDRLVIDGSLAKNKVIELALNFDSSLLALLLKNEKLKKYFFQNVEDVLIFDKVIFQRFVSNKSFLPNSYTSFKNKIGLADHNHEYIKDSNNVSLIWPYKECILEGGQTKDDKAFKTREILWNSMMSPDKVDNLLSPKVFTNFQKISTDDSPISGNESLLIKGNNLLALHSLKYKFREKIKLIYIDPPYNTGSDTFGYNDSFNHSTWLTFMKNRLEIAKELLHPNGSIFVHIDDFEDAYLKVMMDEIFGASNFRNKITWKRRGGSANPTGRLNNVVDYIIWFSKNEQFTFKPPFTINDKNTQKYIKERFTNIDENGRKFMKSPIQSPNPRPNLMYDYKGYKTPTKGWSISKEKMEEWDLEGKLCFPDDKNKNINRKIYLDEYKGQPVSSLWTDINVINPMSKERGEFLGGQKPEALIKRIIEMTTEEGDLVLDFFAGSGTTAATALKTKRKFITCEQMEYVKGTTLSRLKNVINGDDSGVSKEVKWEGGGDFVYCELAELSSIYIDKIELAKNSNELINIWDELKVTNNLSYNIAPNSVDSNINEFSKLSLQQQKQFLIEVVDKNQLYINYSDIDDESNNISEQDKVLNKQFYGE
jgi:adenine-specific DNA-methyltransferase